MDELFSTTKKKILAIGISIILFILSITVLNFRNKQDDKEGTDFGHALGIVGLLFSIQIVGLIILLELF